MQQPGGANRFQPAYTVSGKRNTPGATQRGILAWGSGPKGEPPEYTGLDVVVVREGKIAAL
jgi:hypothetical protein